MTAQAYAELISEWTGPGDPPQNPVRDDELRASGKKQPLDLKRL